MPWIKLDKPNKLRKKWINPIDRYNIPDAMKLRAPYFYDYQYSYGVPYGDGSSEDKYDNAPGGKIHMDPEKRIYAE